MREYDTRSESMRSRRRRFDDDSEIAPSRTRRLLADVEHPRRPRRHRPRWPAGRRPLVHMGRRPARPETPPALGDHRARRGGHRARRAQDRQGGRRPRHRAVGTGLRAGASCWRPSGTAARSTGCSTATPATRRAVGSAGPGRCGRWPGVPSSAATCCPGSGRRPSSPRCPALWSAGVAVPYPVQLVGTELLLEFVGDADGRAAPRLAQLRPDPEQLRELWRQLTEALLGLAARASPTATCRPTTCWCTTAGWC